MSISRIARLGGLIWLVAAVPALADTALNGQILKQLACTGTPDPTPVLLALKQAGGIDFVSAKQQDSSTCWALTPPLDFDGVDFDHICAASENPQAIAAHPDFYWRGPGTSAGTELALATSADSDALQHWAGKALPVDQPNYTVSESARLDGESEISCLGFEEADDASASDAAPVLETASPLAPVAYVPAIGSDERKQISVAVHGWLQQDELTIPTELIYEEIRSTGVHAYIFAKVRTPAGKTLAADIWAGTQGCETDPDPGEVEALLSHGPNGWAIIKANRCADDVLIDEGDKAKYQLPDGFTNQF